ESAENIIAASLAQARLSAIRDQAPRGLVFYRDPATDRIAMAMVRVASPGEWASAPPSFNPIEVLAETDAQFLPSGVDIAFRHNTGTGADQYVYRFTTGPLQGLRGVILFDSRGHIAYRHYGIGRDTELARRLGVSDHEDKYNSGLLYSQPAFLLADRSAADNAADIKTYYNDNAIVILVNRYNGTLTRSE